jgi:peptidoglycan hydrolase CwlO-like protein
MAGLTMSFWPYGFTSADRAVLNQLAATMKTVTTTLGKIMSEDATIAATAADIEADVTALKTAMASSAALIASLQAEIAAGTTAVSPSTMAALAQAKTDLDAVAAPPAA